jgi:hypothetical protein
MARQTAGELLGGVESPRTTQIDGGMRQKGRTLKFQRAIGETENELAKIEDMVRLGLFFGE